PLGMRTSTAPPASRLLQHVSGVLAQQLFSPPSSHPRRLLAEPLFDLPGEPTPAPLALAGAPPPGEHFLLPRQQLFAHCIPALGPPPSPGCSFSGRPAKLLSP